MAKELPDRLKGAKSLPDGKVQLRDGTIMSRSAWMSRRSAFAPDLVRITSSGSKPKPRVSAREAERQAKRGRADIKKGEKTNPMTNTLAASKKDTPARRTARVAAAERARLVAPDKRTPAQKLAIKSASRMKGAGTFEAEWRKLTADVKRSAAELRAAGKKERGESKKGGRKSPGGPRRLFVGRGGARGGGSMGGSGGGLPDYNR